MDISLYDFQAASVEALRSNFRKGVVNQVLSAPTGSGKTIVATYLLKACFEKGTRAVFVADRLALIDQTSAVLDRYGVPHGIIQAQNERALSHAKIQVATVQTLDRRGWPDADLIIVDEAHALHRATSRRILPRETKTIGLTATPFAKGMGLLYDAVVSVTTTNALIESGTLSKYRIFAASQPDMTGAKVRAGEWTEDEAASRSMPIIGDCVAEYLKHGQGKKFIAFGVNVAHCLDSSTEILTRRGWATIDDIQASDMVASFDHRGEAGGRIVFSRPKEIIKRQALPGERFLTIQNNLLNLRVTEQHRMLTRQDRSQWTFRLAKECVGKAAHVPVSGRSAPEHVAVENKTSFATPRPERVGGIARRLRKSGMSDNEARDEAERRVRSREALRYKNPHELTLDECRFIGFWLGDGSRSGKRSGVAFTQSERYPEIIQWFDDLLARLGVDVRRYTGIRGSNAYETSHAQVVWNVPSGRHYGAKHRRGMHHLEPYLRKEGTDLYWGLSEEQYLALIDGLAKADGRHGATTGLAHRITGSNRGLFDLLQAIGVCRGCRVSMLPRRMPADRKKAYTLSVRPDRATTCGAFRHAAWEDSRDGEVVWCVETELGTIVTRRAGRVTIMGNCEEMQRQFHAAGVPCALYTYHEGDEERRRMVEEFRKPDSRIRGLLSVSAIAKGFDVSDVGVVILARPLRSSLAEHIQMFGRGLRSHPGKDECIYLDHSGNTVRFWSEMQEFFENGALELDDGKRKESKKQEPKEKKPAKCPKCHCVHKPAPICPACGHQYERRSAVVHEAGELSEVAGRSSTRAEKQVIYSQLLYVARERNYAPGWAAHKYRERTGVWPSGLNEHPAPPTPDMLNWLRSRVIAFHKAKERGRR